MSGAQVLEFLGGDLDLLIFRETGLLSLLLHLLEQVLEQLLFLLVNEILLLSERCILLALARA